MLTKILPATSFWTTDPSIPSQIRVGSSGPAARPPVSIVEVMQKAARDFPDHPALIDVLGNSVSYSDYENQVKHYAKVFIKLGLEARHSVAILATNSPEWFYAELAAIYAGGLAAGVYPTSSEEGTFHIANVSRANIIVVDEDHQLKKVLAIKFRLPLLKAIVQINPSSTDGTKPCEGYYNWGELKDVDVGEVEDEYARRQSKIGVNEAAILVFTSGTTGTPKGVMISHDNMIWNCHRYLSDTEMSREVLISMLPPSHISGQLDIFLALITAGTIHFAERDAMKGSIIDTLADVRPTIFTAMPRLYEKLSDRLLAMTKFNTGVSSRMAEWSEGVSMDNNFDGSQEVSKSKWQFSFARGLILNRLKRALGLDRCHLIICGGAPLSPELKRYFLGMDLPVSDFFGMSETAGVNNMCPVDAGKINSIGRTLPGSETMVRDGEICIRGRNVFMGYLYEEEKTHEALDEDGWLRTGDLGYEDEDGYFYITGRLKELIITSGGENIPPVHIEHLVKCELPAVSNAFVIGDQRKYLTMLIALKTEMDKDGSPKDELSQESIYWMRSLGLDYVTLSELIKAGPCPKVIEAINEGIKRANLKAISNAQKVQKFTLLEHDFSIVTGELGPTTKVKRKVVNDMYAHLIDRMYE